MFFFVNVMYKEMFRRDLQHQCADGASFGSMDLRWSVSAGRKESASLIPTLREFLFSFQSMERLENKLVLLIMSGNILVSTQFSQ